MERIFGLAGAPEQSGLVVLVRLFRLLIVLVHIVKLRNVVFGSAKRAASIRRMMRVLH